MVDATRKKSKDFVIATGRQESVRTFLEIVAKKLGWLGIVWEGSDLNEIGEEQIREKL